MIPKRRYRSIEKYLRKNLVEGVAGRNDSASFGAVGHASLSLKHAKTEFLRSDLSIPDVADKRQSSRSRSLEDIVSQPEESFSRMLFRLIREKGVEEVDTYKTAQIDRKHFSKIRSNDDYRPNKSTALSLALALKLNLDDTLDLLGKAGFTLSHSSRFDLIIEYFIQNSIHDIFEINQALDVFGQPAI